jgi:hypothetical protein
MGFIIALAASGILWALAAVAAWSGFWYWQIMGHLQRIAFHHFFGW